MAWVFSIVQCLVILVVAIVAQGSRPVRSNELWRKRFRLRSYRREVIHQPHRVTRKQQSSSDDSQDVASVVSVVPSCRSSLYTSSCSRANRKPRYFMKMGQCRLPRRASGRAWGRSTVLFIQGRGRLVSQYPSILRRYPSIPVSSAGQTLEGSFSAVSKPILQVNTKCYRRELHKTHLCTDLRYQIFNQKWFQKSCKQSAIFVCKKD